MDENTTDEPSPTLSEQRDSDETDENDALLKDPCLHVEALLRNHLKSVTYPASQPPNNIDTLAEIRTAILLRWAEVLEQARDVVAAILIVAALNVAGDGDETAIVDEFLQSALVSFLDSPEKGTEFLYTVLGELTQRETNDGDNQADFSDGEWETEDSDDQADLSDGKSTSPGSPLLVLVGTETIPVSFDQLLPFFWSPDDRLASDCHACGLPFVVGDPPIRTVNIAMDGARTLEVRVFNRHFTCIKDKRIRFVPVSHVWTDSIREANANQAHNEAAATKLINTLMDLGMGAEGAYDPEVEFWHDYFSVPQWQPEVKEQLLARLPAIYHLPDEILVHLEDVPSISVTSLFLSATRMDNNPVLEVITILPHIRGLYGSEWMTRMWVTLEHVQCHTASVMTKGGFIHRLRDYTPQTQSGTLSGMYARDSFSHLLAIADLHLPNLFRYARIISISLRDHLEQIIDGPGLRPLISGHPRGGLFLGEAMDLLQGKQCQYPRDRFIALDVLLDGRRKEWLPATVLPGPDAEACAHVWIKALRLGDYSPLLLQPPERIPGSNPPTQSGLASWLVGHSGLEGVKWDNGWQTRHPLCTPVISDDGDIHVTLALAGQLEEICYLDVEQSGTVGGVAFALHLIYGMAKAEGVELSPELLVDGLNRILPYTDNQREDALFNGRPFSFAEFHGRVPEFSDQICRLLTQYEGAIGDASSTAQVAQSVSDVLGLDVDIYEYEGRTDKFDTRLNQSKALAMARRNRGAKGGDPICKVRCPECLKVTFFRLDLRETGGVGQQLYRIPGLAYNVSIKDGVGLVIDKEGQITGRMFYGPPACDCRLLVEVEIH